ncbi:putative glycoprotein [Wuhan aphid virus 2]|uniref:putative glycoprotein n=1 Tax=Wuhan aphid virus 2 TaxID=1746068 RepID=UPI0007067CDB|nr:putative glycoprotein [Wuhan aphid virus 2]ALL52894.1 putative glycoprotein [Wuhan aphid virus 2]
MVSTDERKDVPSWDWCLSSIRYAFASAALRGFWNIPVWINTIVLGMRGFGYSSSVRLASKQEDVLTSWLGIIICYCFWSEGVLADLVGASDPAMYISPGSSFSIHIRHQINDLGTNLTLTAGDPTDNWIYTGTEDPYCYAEITYDTIWFESKNAFKHCSEQVSSQGCSLVDYHGVSALSVFQNENTLTCIGLKTTVSSVLAGMDPNWDRVFSLPLDNMFGKVHYIYKDKKYYFINPYYFSKTLHYFKDSFYNLRLVNSKRVWLSWDLLVYHVGDNLKDMLIQFPLVNIVEKEENPKKYSIIKPSSKLENKQCTVAYGPVHSPNFLRGAPLLSQVSSVENEKYYKYPGIRMGTPNSLALCGITTIDALASATPQKLVIVDESLPWYIKLRDWLIRLVSKLVDGTLSTVVGKNWQGRLTVAFLTYYLSSTLTKSVGAGVFVSFVIVYNLFFR